MRAGQDGRAADIGIAEAMLQYTQQTERCRRELKEALLCCRALQADIAALPDAAASAGQARELAGLCKKLEDAVRTLRRRLEEYPGKCREAELQCQKRIYACVGRTAQKKGGARDDIYVHH